METHAHRVGDAIQPSHPLSSPSPPTFNLFQHQGLFKWDSTSYQVTRVLEFQLQHQSFQWTPRTDLLQDGLESPCSPRDSQESSPTQFKSIHSLVFIFHLHSGPTLTSIHDYWKNHSFDHTDISQQNIIPSLMFASRKINVALNQNEIAMKLKDACSLEEKLWPT